MLQFIGCIVGYTIAVLVHAYFLHFPKCLATTFFTGLNLQH